MSSYNEQNRQYAEEYQHNGGARYSRRIHNQNAVNISICGLVARIKATLQSLGNDEKGRYGDSS